MIFKQTPLAIKNGAYYGYRSNMHNYYSSPWSANNVVFLGPQKNLFTNNGYQNFYYKGDGGNLTWAEWKVARDAKYGNPAFHTWYNFAKPTPRSELDVRTFSHKPESGTFGHVI
jgi:hypothetical protein